MYFHCIIYHIREYDLSFHVIISPWTFLILLSYVCLGFVMGIGLFVVLPFWYHYMRLWHWNLLLYKIQWGSYNRRFRLSWYKLTENHYSVLVNNKHYILGEWGSFHGVPTFAFLFNSLVVCGYWCYSKSISTFSLITVSELVFQFCVAVVW